VIDARAIVLGKDAAAESVGGGEDGGHRRWGGGERSREGRRRGRGEVRGKKTTEGGKLDGQHVYFLFQPTLDCGAKIQTEIFYNPSGFAHFRFSTLPVFEHRISCHEAGRIVYPERPIHQQRPRGGETIEERTHLLHWWRISRQDRSEQW